MKGTVPVVLWTTRKKTEYLSWVGIGALYSGGPRCVCVCVCVYISFWKQANMSKLFNWIYRYHQGNKSSYDCFLPHPAFWQLLNYHKNSVSEIYYRKWICFSWIRKFLIITKFIEYKVTTSVFTNHIFNFPYGITGMLSHRCFLHVTFISLIYTVCVCEEYSHNFNNEYGFFY